MVEYDARLFTHHSGSTCLATPAGQIESIAQTMAQLWGRARPKLEHVSTGGECMVFVSWCTDHTCENFDAHGVSQLTDLNAFVMGNSPARHCALSLLHQAPSVRSLKRQTKSASQPLHRAVARWLYSFMDTDHTAVLLPESAHPSRMIVSLIEGTCSYYYKCPVSIVFGLT